jgi:hypothetical protein
LKPNYKEIAQGIAKALSVKEIENQILRFKLGIWSHYDWARHTKNKPHWGCCLCNACNPMYLKDCQPCPYGKYAKDIKKGCFTLKEGYGCLDAYCKARVKLYANALKIKQTQNKKGS